MLFKIIILLAATVFARFAEADDSFRVVTADRDVLGHWYVLADRTSDGTKQFSGKILPKNKTAVVIKYLPLVAGETTAKIDESFGEKGYLFLDSLLEARELRFLDINCGADLVVHGDRILVLTNVLVPLEGELITGNRPVLLGLTSAGKLDLNFGEENETNEFGEDSEYTGMQTDVGGHFATATGRKIAIDGNDFAVLSSDVRFHRTQASRTRLLISRYFNSGHFEKQTQSFLYGDPEVIEDDGQETQDLGEVITREQFFEMVPQSLEMLGEAELEDMVRSEIARQNANFRLWIGTETVTRPLTSAQVSVQNLAMQANARGNFYVLGIASDAKNGRVVGFKYSPEKQHRGKTGKFRRLVQRPEEIAPKYDVTGEEFALLPLPLEGSFSTAQWRPASNQTFIFSHDQMGQRTADSKILNVAAPFPLRGATEGSFRLTSLGNYLLLGHGTGPDRIVATVLNDRGGIVSRTELPLAKPPAPPHWCASLIADLKRDKKEERGL